MAAANQALSTYELLEQILFQLPVSDIFVLQCVSKFWQQILQGSHPLRRKTFLLSSHPVVTPAQHRETENIDECHPIYDSLLEINPAFRRRGSKIVLQRFPEIMQYHAYKEYRNLNLLTVDFGCTVQLTTADLDTESSGTDLKHSWRDMFLTNPPCSSVLLSSGDVLPEVHLDDEIGCSISDPAGVKLGLMMDTAKYMLADLFRYRSREDVFEDTFDPDGYFTFTIQMKKAEDRVMEG